MQKGFSDKVGVWVSSSLCFPPPQFILGPGSFYLGSLGAWQAHPSHRGANTFSELALSALSPCWTLGLLHPCSLRPAFPVGLSSRPPHAPQADASGTIPSPLPRGTLTKKPFFSFFKIEFTQVTSVCTTTQVSKCTTQ